MDRPTPDAVKLLAAWMEWERGDVTPGRVMANLKTGGLRDLLEGLAAGSTDRAPGPPAQGEQAASWTPIT